MKLIVGLGNPGVVYSNSRHNIGFMVIKSLAKKHGVSFRRNSATSSLCGKGRLDAEEGILALPLTYMNLSGPAVARLVKKFTAGRADLLVVCDDLDLEVGRLRIRERGSSGGHRGLASIIQALGSQDFARLRIGIGRPGQKVAVSDYVLSGFARSEKKLLRESIDAAVDCCEVWATGGIDKSMNIFNRRGVRA